MDVTERDEGVPSAHMGTNSIDSIREAEMRSFIRLTDHKSLEADRLKPMLDSVADRGPDDAGCLFWKTGVRHPQAFSGKVRRLYD